MFKHFKTAFASAGIVLASGLAVTAGTGVAHAATPDATAVTHITQRPDSGDQGNNWALDNLSRTVTITQTGTAVMASDCGAAATSCFTYTGTISDTGTAYATTGAISPGTQDVPIQGSPTAAVTGSATVAFDSSSEAPDAALVPASLAGSGTADQSTTNWVEQFFPAGTTFGDGPQLPTWSWTYVDAKDCQTWTDAASLPVGTVQGDITGVSDCTVTSPPPPPPAVVPVLSHGLGVYISPTRENVQFNASAPGWVKFQITGPGVINQHVGYVNAKAGLNVGVYTGLESHHNYSVLFQDVTGVGGQPVAGSVAGIVDFLS